MMKLTRTALAKYSESIPECAVRRILWNVKDAKRTGKYWNPTSLWSATGRKLEWIKDPFNYQRDIELRRQIAEQASHGGRRDFSSFTSV